MALSRTKKQELVDLYEGGLAKTQNAFLLDFEGIKVPEVTELRQKIRESGASYLVVKNRLALRAIEGNAMGQLKEHFVGATAVAYSDDEPVGLAKALTEFAKDVPAVEFKAGLLDGQAVEPDQIKEIANLPSREELLAKLLFLMQSPVTRFARSLGAITQQFVTVLDQVRANKEES